jgi:hypothetical protein
VFSLDCCGWYLSKLETKGDEQFWDEGKWSNNFGVLSFRWSLDFQVNLGLTHEETGT